MHMLRCIMLRTNLKTVFVQVNYICINMGANIDLRMLIPVSTKINQISIILISDLIITIIKYPLLLLFVLKKCFNFVKRIKMAIFGPLKPINRK